MIIVKQIYIYIIVAKRIVEIAHPDRGQDLTKSEYSCLFPDFLITHVIVPMAHFCSEVINTPSNIVNILNIKVLFFLY